MWVGKEVGLGFALTFTFAPQLVLRCCHFHHLKCCHFRCRSLTFAMGPEGREEEEKEGRRARGRKSGKISILNKHNFVTLSPDYHGTHFAMYTNFLFPLCSFRIIFSSTAYLHLSQELLLVWICPKFPYQCD